MAIDYSLFAFSKGTPRRQEKDEKKRTGRQDLKDAYVEVDARDKLFSVVTGKRLVRGSSNDAVRLEHHHMARRSQAKSRITDPTNVISASAREADYLDSHALVPVDIGGVETRVFASIAGFAWNRRMVSQGKEPFRLLKPMDWNE